MGVGLEPDRRGHGHGGGQHPQELDRREHAVEAFTEAVGRPVVVLNDADAPDSRDAGAGKGVSGVVLMLTLGTGIGSALFVDGALVPNLELGHIEIRGKDAERRASAGARDRKGLSWAQWRRC